MNPTLFAVLLSSFVTLPLYADTRVALPKDYAIQFTEYLSLDRVQHPDQFIRLFANDVALEGTDQSGQLNDGSVLVAEVYSVQHDAEGKVRTSGLNRRMKDKLLLLAVMEKQARFATNDTTTLLTGNWDFAAYKPNGEVAAKNLDTCRACHLPLANTDFVFSIEHLPQANKPQN